ncbi:MAG: hypothetical protein ACI4EU_04275 [Butyrivibrio sp.]
MDILKELQEIRKIIRLLKGWQQKIENKRRSAMYGTGMWYTDRVQVTKRHDAMENRIIAYSEDDEKRKALLNQYIDKCQVVERYVDEYCKETRYINAIYAFFIRGKDIKDIPNCTQNTIKKAVQHIQDNIEMKENEQADTGYS